MDSNEPDTNESRPTSGRPSFIRTALGWILTFALGLGIGYVPMWQKQQTLSQQLTAATASAEAHTDSMEVARMHVLVSAALVEVERGDYDAARAIVSSFYESIDNHWQGAVPAQVPGPVTEIRRTRDETISLLSTSAPDAVQRIRSAHAAFLVVADPSAADIGRALATPRARPDSMAGRPGS